MKKHVIMSLALMFGSLVFAQKKEVSAIDKAIKKGDFNTAKSALQVAEGLISAMDDKTKAKFYFLKGQTLYANGSASDEAISDAIEALDQSAKIESKLPKKVYTGLIDELKIGMVENFSKRGQSALEQDNYSAASVYFENSYRLSPLDTTYLYNSAVLAQNAENYDRALELYDELISLGYTNIYTQYFATEKETNEEITFDSKATRDLSVKVGTHINPKDVEQPSKVSDITKDIALIYVNLGKTEEAIASIEKAKSLNPNDYNLLLAEANIRYKLGEIDTYRDIIKKALELQPDNVDLIYNLGATAAELEDYDSAKEYYDKALQIDPQYINALVAYPFIILNEEQGIVEEMNSLGTSAADDKKFDELQAKRNQLYSDAIPYLERAIAISSKDVELMRTLMSLYSAVDNQDKFEEIKAKIAELEGN